MKPIIAIGLTMLLGLVACEAPTGGPPPSERYQISAQRRAEIPMRVLVAVNQIRKSAGLPPLSISSALSSAAVRHSKDMAQQNRPWHFGSNGSSPLQRVASAGYGGVFHGETVSETYETELETIAIWAVAPGTRDVLLNPNSNDLGIGFFQERTGKLWWTLITGSS